jgi:acetyl esterase/lipase
MLMRIALALAAVPLLVLPVFGQLSPAAEWATNLANRYQISPNVTYLTATGYESKLDVYRRRDVQTPQPTLIFYHGGGWIGGTKESSFLAVMPWLEMGWNVVNVEYRMARVAEAPAAVEDALCALRFVTSPAQAKTYNIDTAKIVVTGESAGGHLALAAGMMTAATGFTNICTGGGFTGMNNAVPPVAAIINWFGISDVNDMLDGPNARAYAVQWIGSSPLRDQVAKSVSPLTYVRPGLPPVLTIHGDKDPIVPYSHATRLHEALTKAGAKSGLHTVAGGGHGGFNAQQRTEIYAKIREFLTANGL